MSVTEQVNLLATRMAEEINVVRSEIGTGGGGSGGGSNFRGDWVPATSYSEGDVVHALGGSWLATKNLPATTVMPAVCHGAYGQTSVGGNGFPLSAPSGAISGDLLVVIVSGSEMNATLDATVSGWTTVYLQQNHKPNLAIYTKIHDGSSGTVFTTKTYYHHSAVIRAYSSGTTIGSVLFGTGIGDTTNYNVPAFEANVGVILNVGVFGNGLANRSILSPGGLTDLYQDTVASNQAFVSGDLEAVDGATPEKIFTANTANASYAWAALPIWQAASSLFIAGDDWAKLGELESTVGDGTVVFRGDWSVDNAYAIGDIVHADGSAWLAQETVSGGAAPIYRGLTSIEYNYTMPQQFLEMPEGTEVGDFQILSIGPMLNPYTMSGWTEIGRSTDEISIVLWSRLVENFDPVTLPPDAQGGTGATLRSYGPDTVLGAVSTGTSRTIPAKSTEAPLLAAFGLFVNPKSFVEMDVVTTQASNRANGNLTEISGLITPVNGTTPAITFTSGSPDAYVPVWITVAIQVGGGFHPGDVWAKLGVLEVPPSRITGTLTTGSIADSENDIGNITLAKSYRLMSITTDKPCRVRFYATMAQQTADASRPIGTDPTGNHGLMFEFVTTIEVLTSALSPFVDGSNLEVSPTTSIPISIQNLSGSTGTVTVSFVYIGTE